MVTKIKIIGRWLKCSLWYKHKQIKKLYKNEFFKLYCFTTLEFYHRINLISNHTQFTQFFWINKLLCIAFYHIMNIVLGWYFAQKWTVKKKTFYYTQIISALFLFGGRGNKIKTTLSRKFSSRRVVFEVQKNYRLLIGVFPTLRKFTLKNIWEKKKELKNKQTLNKTKQWRILCIITLI